MNDPHSHSVTIVTPSLSGTKVRALLRSLAKQTIEIEVIVADNDSPLGEVSEACGDFAFARPIRLARNEGFSRAVNLAAARATGDVLVIVNDDSECDTRFAEELRDAIRPEDGVMMAAGVMLDARSPDTIETAGIEIDRTLLAFDYLNGEPVGALDEATEPLGPSGAAAAFWREAFEQAGGFDERIFAYSEDVDLALRLRTLGHRCALAKGARGVHAHSATLGSGSSEKNHLMGFGRTYLLRKWSVVSPRNLLPILLREFVVCAGQLLLDRNAGGLRGRIAGMRADVERQPYPAAALEGSPGRGVVRGLAQRMRRRWRLRR